jgi:hypothetical protein
MDAQAGLVTMTPIPMALAQTCLSLVSGTRAPARRAHPGVMAVAKVCAGAFRPNLMTRGSQ